MSMSQDTVTIEKVYLETLLRRAQFHTSGADATTPVDPPTVTILKAEYDSLLTTARQYANLRRNLFVGGLNEDILAVLLGDPPTINENGDSTSFSAAEDSTEARAHLNLQSVTQARGGSNGTAGVYNGDIGGGWRQDYTYGRNANYTPRNGDLKPRDTNSFQNHSPTNGDGAYMLDDPSDGFYDDGNGYNDSQKSTRKQYSKYANRTVLLANLAEGVTHADIVDVVRGGMLLDVYLRTDGRAASVSFLEEAHAQEFFRHAKRYDLYIRGKRVEIRWHDRQFVLSGSTTHKLAVGATRNLVIRNRKPNHTEEMIRADLDHIHGLVVIKVVLNDQNAFISTNSVHNAMFARTCMQSRATYKGSKIEWVEDECAAPLVKAQPIRQENLVPKKKSDTRLNRFHLLNMDGSEYGSLEDDDNDTSGITLQSTGSPLAT